MRPLSNKKNQMEKKYKVPPNIAALAFEIEKQRQESQRALEKDIQERITRAQENSIALEERFQAEVWEALKAENPEVENWEELAFDTENGTIVSLGSLFDKPPGETTTTSAEFDFDSVYSGHVDEGFNSAAEPSIESFVTPDCNRVANENLEDYLDEFVKNEGT